MCHNCGVSTTFYNFIKLLDAGLLAEYQLERYKNGETGNNNYPKPSFDEVNTEKPVFREKLQLPTIESLQEGHFAKQYVQKRKIPESYFTNLYYAEDFKEFVESFGIQKELLAGDKRLIIPFYDEEKNLIAFQGRALGESKLRYITVKLHDDNKKLFGLDRINQEEKIYVVEGPIDSMFLDNSVATCDSHLEAASEVLNRSNLVLVFDNEPRNKEIVRQIERAIDNHFNVVIWPEMIEEKDINDMILAGFTSDDINDIIDNHTYQNLRAKLEFMNWKKI